MQRFTAVGGVDAEISSATAQRRALGDRRRRHALHQPGLGTGSTPVTVDLNVTGRTTLRLVTGDAGNGVDYDHADWADARLLC